MLLAGACHAVPPHSASPKAAIFEEYLTKMAEVGAFNGNVLVAEDGEVIYRRSLGCRSADAADALDLDSQFCLASASKPFTALAVVQLKEAGLLAYDDPVARFIPEWPYEGGTVRHLLQNRSGYPGHVFLLRDPLQPWLRDTDAEKVIRSHEEMIRLFTELHPAAHFPPGQRFRSSATDYVLLACIVERVTGMPFARYMREKVFLPAGMADTFVVGPFREDPLRNRAHGFTQALDGPGLVSLEGRHRFHWEGGSGVYSTVEDLWRFLCCLRAGGLVSPTSLDEVWTPPSSPDGKPAAFGFGWSWIPLPPGGRPASATGHAEGFACGIVQELDAANTILVLTNCDLYLWGGLIQNLGRILHGQPYELPPPSPERDFARILLTKGLEEARRFLAASREADPENTEWGPSQLAETGHLLLREGFLEQGLQTFELNLVLFPDSPIALNGLGDGYLASGDQEAALACFRRAAAAAPGVEALRNKVAQLEERMRKDA